MTAPAFVIVHGIRLERIAPGVYSDGNGGMHLAVLELLAAHGYANTPENVEMVLDAARELLAQNPARPELQVLD